MGVLLDECVPRPLRRELRGHEVRTVPEMGWAGKKNGALLALIKGAGFEVFVTTDPEPGVSAESSTSRNSGRRPCRSQEYAAIALTSDARATVST